MEQEFEKSQEAIFGVDESNVSFSEKSNLAVYTARCCRWALLIVPTVIALACLIAVIVIAAIFGSNQALQAMLTSESKTALEAKVSNLEVIIFALNNTLNGPPSAGSTVSPNFASLAMRVTDLEQKLGSQVDNSNQLSKQTTFIRWGSSTCPTTNGTELIYSGYTASSGYPNQGGGSNHLCLPTNPENTLPKQPGTQAGGSTLYGAEYESDLFGRRNSNVPCAVCSITGRDNTLMIPAKTSCPASWTSEYIGYIMSEGVNNYRTNFICVDSSQEVVPETSNHDTATDLFHAEATCTNLPCPPYNTDDEINCIVCSR